MLRDMIAGATYHTAMCGRADDNFGPAGWDVLTRLSGSQRWELEPMRNEVRPTDPLRFVRRNGRGWDAQYGRWGLIPARMTLNEAKNLDSFQRSGLDSI